MSTHQTTSITAGLPYDDVVPYDDRKLDQLLSKTKANLFRMKHSGFLGSLMCDHEFIWDDTCTTAWCNGKTIGWNRKFFTWLSTEERVTVLAHEIWHSGYGHMIRRGDRDPRMWNIAGDYVINIGLSDDAFVFGEKLTELGVLLKDKYRNWSTEQVYDDLMDNPPDNLKDLAKGIKAAKSGTGSSGKGSSMTQEELDALAEEASPLTNDVREDSGDPHKVISNIVRAEQKHKMSKTAGALPGEIQAVIDEFLNPVLPWEQLLMRYFTELSHDDYSWARPNRRYQDIYLPSRLGSNGLEHIVYYLDISGSITDQDVLRFNSEVRYIHTTLQPERLTLVTFDTRIHDRFEFERDMPFEKLEITGRGGTSLHEVEEDIRNLRPSAAVIFTDLYCSPMQLDPRVPLIWIVTGNPGAKVPFGRMIHLPEEKD